MPTVNICSENIYSAFVNNSVCLLCLNIDVDLKSSSVEVLFVIMANIISSSKKKHHPATEKQTYQHA